MLLLFLLLVLLLKVLLALRSEIAVPIATVLRFTAGLLNLLVHRVAPAAGIVLHRLGLVVMMVSFWVLYDRGVLCHRHRATDNA